MDYGALSLVPVGVAIIAAVLTKRTFEPLLLGALSGFIVTSGTGFFGVSVDAIYATMAEGIVQWLLIICFLWGAIIALLEKSGGIPAFAEFVIRKLAKTEKSSLMATWLLGVILFFDDYLNALVLGTSMSKVTDKHKTSREMLAYIADSTAAPMAIIIPISTWGIFAAGIVEETVAAGPGEGVSFYLQSMPFIFYGWAAVIVVPLVIWGVIPKIGPMKRAEKRAKDLGILRPPGSEKIDLLAEVESIKGSDSKKIDSFLLPLILLVILIFATGGDAIIALIITVVFSIIYYAIRGVMNVGLALDSIYAGVKSFVPIMLILFGSFYLKEANDQLGLTDYVIRTVEPIMTGAYLPVVSFLVLSFVAFATGTFWGTIAISIPIVIPLAEAMGVPFPLAAAAVFSAGGFGSHMCIYGDCTVMSSGAAGCNNIDHVATQFPYVMISVGLAAIAFLITGLILT